MGIKGAMVDVKKQMVEKKYISEIVAKKKKKKLKVRPSATGAAPAEADPAPAVTSTGKIQVPIVVNLGVVGGAALKAYFPETDE